MESFRLADAAKGQLNRRERQVFRQLRGVSYELENNPAFGPVEYAPDDLPNLRGEGANSRGFLGICHGQQLQCGL